MLRIIQKLNVYDQHKVTWKNGYRKNHTVNSERQRRKQRQIDYDKKIKNSKEGTNWCDSEIVKPLLHFVNFGEEFSFLLVRVTAL